MPPAPALDVAALRAQLPALEAGAAHFDGPGGSQTPDVVARAITATLTAPLANRGVRTKAERNAERAVLAARAAMADLLGVDAGGVVFGRSMTALAFDLARTLAAGWGPGDEVVVSRLDHDANIRPWVIAAERAGAAVRWAELEPETGELPVEAVAAVVGERTRLVAVTAASNLIGTMPDVAAIAGVAHGAGALLAVDGVHLSAHHLPDVAALGADLYFCSPYKFLGPHCGVLAADPGFLATLHPDKLAASTEAVPERFELGTLPYELLAGTTAAVDLLAGLDPAGVGPDPTGADRRARLRRSYAAIADHEDRLRARIEAGLPRGSTCWSRAARRTPTLLVTVDGHRPVDISDALAQRGVNAPAGSFYALEASRLLGLGDDGGVRIGLAPYNDDADVDRLLDALASATSGITQTRPPAG